MLYSSSGSGSPFFFAPETINEGVYGQEDSKYPFEDFKKDFVASSSVLVQGMSCQFLRHFQRK